MRITLQGRIISIYFPFPSFWKTKQNTYLSTLEEVYKEGVLNALKRHLIPMWKNTRGLICTSCPSYSIKLKGCETLQGGLIKNLKPPVDIGAMSSPLTHLGKLMKGTYIPLNTHFNNMFHVKSFIEK